MNVTLKEAPGTTVADIDQESLFFGIFGPSEVIGLFIRGGKMLIRLGPGDIQYWVEKDWSIFEVADFRYINYIVSIDSVPEIPF